jgi:hypothetical protein
MKETLGSFSEQTVQNPGREFIAKGQQTRKQFTVVRKSQDHWQQPSVLIASYLWTVNEFLLAAVPAAAATVMGPVIAPAGTITVSDARELSEILALTLPNLPRNVTDFTWTKFVPVILTPVPTGPADGRKLVIAGGCGSPEPWSLGGPGGTSGTW